MGSDTTTTAAHFASRTVTVRRTVHALARLTDLTACAICVLRTLGLAASATFTDFVGSAVSVEATSNTLVPFTNKTREAVGSLATVTVDTLFVFAEFAGATFVVAGTIRAGVVFTQLTFGGTVRVDLTVGFATSVLDTQLTGTTLTVRLTSRTLVLGTNLTVLAIGVVSTITRNTLFVQAKVPSSTVLVVGACGTKLVLTNLSVATVAVVCTAFALVGLGVTRLPLLAVAVGSTTRSALSAFADVALSATILVFIASFTFVLCTDLTVLTIGVRPAISGDTLA